MITRGIILAGGTGTRLHPLTISVSKQLMPVYDKPMIFFPLSVLMLAGIREVLVITTPEDRPAFERLLGHGARWGMAISYAEQPRPEGIAQAFLIAEAFIASEPCALILGDNIFFGFALQKRLRDAATLERGATIFGYRVADPSAYGVVQLDPSGAVIGIEEKPARPRSPYAIVGLYLYDGEVVDFARRLRPSARGELEISDLNRAYLEAGTLRFEKLGRGTAWLDTGTPESLLQAANFVQTIQERQGLQVACPEEIAFHNHWIDAESLRAMARPLENTRYGRYLLRVADGLEEA